MSLLPTNEYQRLVELAELDLDYSDAGGQLQDLTRLAARITDTEISLINLIDNYTQWTVADTGLPIQQMPREESVCTYTILQESTFEIRDLSIDRRFSDNPYVRDDPKLRYYCGVPLKTADRVCIGALCVLDTVPQELSSKKKELLTIVASLVVRRLEEIKKAKNFKDEFEALKASKLKLSHDVRNALSGIIGISQLLKEEPSLKGHNEPLDLVRMIQSSAESLLELADSIMAERDADLEPDENQFSCKAFSQKLNDLYLPQAKAKEVALEFNVPDGSEDIFFARAYLLQIAGNLLSNAIKFTAEGGWVRVMINVVRVSETSLDQKLILEVEDSGTGMAESKIQHILTGDALSEQGTQGEKGYGYGLALVVQLVAKLGGQLDLQSKAGEGTYFRVVLPLHSHSMLID